MSEQIAVIRPDNSRGICCKHEVIVLQIKLQLAHSLHGFWDTCNMRKVGRALSFTLVSPKPSCRDNCKGANIPWKEHLEPCMSIFLRQREKVVLKPHWQHLQIRDSVCRSFWREGKLFSSYRSDLFSLYTQWSCSILLFKIPQTTASLYKKKKVVQIFLKFRRVLNKVKKCLIYLRIWKCPFLHMSFLNPLVLTRQGFITFLSCIVWATLMQITSQTISLPFNIPIRFPLQLHFSDTCSCIFSSPLIWQ